MPRKKSLINLSDEERENLQQTTHKGVLIARKFNPDLFACYECAVDFDIYPVLQRFNSQVTVASEEVLSQADHIPNPVI